jgi:hypothetical protein
MSSGSFFIYLSHGATNIKRGIRECREVADIGPLLRIRLTDSGTRQETGQERLCPAAIRQSGAGDTKQLARTSTDERERALTVSVKRTGIRATLPSKKHHFFADARDCPLHAMACQRSFALVRARPCNVLCRMPRSVSPVLSGGPDVTTFPKFPEDTRT